MASVYTMTTIDMSQAKKKEMYDAVGEALAGTFPAYSLILDVVPPDNCLGGAVGQTTFFICTPPYMEYDRRRVVIRDLNLAMVKVFGPLEPKKVIVLFKYHPDDCCGVHGVMRSDAKKEAAK